MQNQTHNNEPTEHDDDDITPDRANLMPTLPARWRLSRCEHTQAHTYDQGHGRHNVLVLLMTRLGKRQKEGGQKHA